MQQKKTLSESRAASPIVAFEYPAEADTTRTPDWSGFANSSEATSTHAPTKPHAVQHPQGAQKPDDTTEPAISAVQLAEEKRWAFEEGRRTGLEEGRQAERESQAQILANGEEKQTQQAAKLIESFAAERDRYLQAIEPEVVKLALAVAARILRREAQMDPLLLTGAVRVALGQLARSTEVRLKVPDLDLDLWTEAIALLPNLALKPSVIAGEGMRLGDCVIEASMGTVDLGIRAQLAEIERGFFDRAGAQKPASLTSVPDAVETSREKQA